MDVATHKKIGTLPSSSSSTARNPPHQVSTVYCTKYGNDFEYTSRLSRRSTRTDKPGSLSGMFLN